MGTSDIGEKAAGTVVADRASPQAEAAGESLRTHSRRRPGAGRTTVLGWSLLGPSLVWVALVSFVPIGAALDLSLYKTNFITKVDFVGLKNYRDVFTGPGNIKMLVVSGIFLGCSLILAVGVSLVLAVLLDMKLAGITGFRTLLMIPWVTSGLLAGLLWKWVVSPLVGPVPYILSDITSGSPGGNVDLLSTQTGALAVLIFVVVWKLYPFGMVLFLASIRTIPRELFEAARVDGAGPLSQFRYITLPAIKNTLIIVSVFFTIMFLTMAEVPLVITGGGPSGATNVVGLDIYHEAFQVLDTGGAAALAVVVFLVNIVLGIVYIRSLRSDDI